MVDTTMEEDLRIVVAEFFAKQDAEWYSPGIHKLWAEWLLVMGRYFMN